jgi:hypothetical protein
MRHKGLRTATLGERWWNILKVGPAYYNIRKFGSRKDTWTGWHRFLHTRFPRKQVFIFNKFIRTKLINIYSASQNSRIRLESHSLATSALGHNNALHSGAQEVLRNIFIMVSLFKYVGKYYHTRRFQEGAEYPQKVLRDPDYGPRRNCLSQNRNLLQGINLQPSVTSSISYTARHNG